MREAEAAGVARAFGGFRSVGVGDLALTSEARAAGIRAATSPVVVLTEDHCWPEPEWAEALLRAHRGGDTVAGPAVVNANPHTVLSWANFLVEYSEWMFPCSTTTVAHLPGHNSSYKRDVLMALGPDLAPQLEAESLLHWRLHAEGARLSVAPDAVTRHLNFSLLWPSLGVRLNSGRLFAGMRRVPWPRWRSLVYAGGSVLIPPLRFSRIIGRVMKPGRAALVPWLSYPDRLRPARHRRGRRMPRVPVRAGPGCGAHLGDRLSPRDVPEPEGPGAPRRYGRMTRVECSVVIPTRDRPGPLDTCLGALAAQTLPRDRFEVIVVDDGSRAPVTPRLRRLARTAQHRTSRRRRAQAPRPPAMPASRWRRAGIWRSPMTTACPNRAGCRRS